MPTPQPSQHTPSPDSTDLRHLGRCVELAAEALAAGDRPFGSVLVGADGEVLAEERNRVSSVDPTQHPEFALARWAAAKMTSGQRAASTVYTSGEHCPMCSAAHALAGLGRIVCATTTAQLQSWHREWGIAPGPVAPLSIREVAPQLEVLGPTEDLVPKVRHLHARLHGLA